MGTRGTVRELTSSSFDAGSSPLAEIPTVNVAPFVHPERYDDGARYAVVEAVADAEQRLGLMYVVGHAVPNTIVRRCLKAARSFFQQDVATKLLSNPRTPKSPGYGVRGEKTYLPRSSQASLASKEILDLGPPTSADGEVRPDPYSGKPHDFRPAVSELYYELQRLESLLLEILSLALGQVAGVAVEPEFLRRAQGAHRGLLRLNYFPICDFESPPDALRDGAHTDWSSLTILYVEREGLEAWDGTRWLPVPPVADALVVNIGDQLHRWSNGKFVACRHRVTLQGSREHPRISIAYFGTECFAEHDESVVVPICAIGEEPRFPPLLIRAYLTQRFAETFPAEEIQ